MPAPERLLRGLEQRVGGAVDRDRDVTVRLANEVGELGRERGRIEVGAPGDVTLEPSVAKPLEHGDRVPFVRQVELVVGEEDRHTADASLARLRHRPLEFLQHDLEVPVRMLPPEVRRRAVHALHRAADARPHRERVRRRVERLSARGPGEPEVVRLDPVSLSLPDQSRRLTPGRVRNERGDCGLARTDHAVLEVEVLQALLGACREARAARHERRLGRDLGQRLAQLADLRQQEADVDRLLAFEAVDHDAVVDDPDPEPDHVRPEPLGRLARGPDRILRHEIGIEELDLGARVLGRRPHALEPVRGHGRDPLERVGVDQEDAASAPGCGGPGWSGHGRLSVALG